MSKEWVVWRIWWIEWNGWKCSSMIQLYHSLTNIKSQHRWNSLRIEAHIIKQLSSKFCWRRLLGESTSSRRRQPQLGLPLCSSGSLATSTHITFTIFFPSDNEQNDITITNTFYSTCNKLLMAMNNIFVHLCTGFAWPPTKLRAES